jgi:hypothetical protein
MSRAYSQKDLTLVRRNLLGRDCGGSLGHGDPQHTMERIPRPQYTCEAYRTALQVRHVPSVMIQYGAVTDARHEDTPDPPSAIPFMGRGNGTAVQ